MEQFARLCYSLSTKLALSVLAVLAPGGCCARGGTVA
jgi:hypothetical protein